MSLLLVLEYHEKVLLRKYLKFFGKTNIIGINLKILDFIGNEPLYYKRSFVPFLLFLDFGIYKFFFIGLRQISRRTLVHRGNTKPFH